MAPLIALPLFVVALAVTLSAAATFARRLDQLGAKFGLPEVIIGLLTAMAADGPEVSSALAALSKGAHEAGVGVIVGSNAFNLAAMVGLSALLAGERLDLALLAAMTVVTLALLRHPRGMRRPGGAAVVGLYVVFVVIQLVAA